MERLKTIGAVLLIILWMGSGLYAAVYNWGGGDYSGLSTDVKPTATKNGQRFYETDTYKLYVSYGAGTTKSWNLASGGSGSFSGASTCAAGQVVTGLSATGLVSCATDSIGSGTYGGASSCSAGSLVSALSSTGLVTCSTDSVGTWGGASACAGGMVVSSISNTGLVSCSTTASGVSGTGFMLVTNGSASLVSSESVTSKFLGVDDAGNIGLFDNMLVSMTALTGMSDGVQVVSGGSWTILSAQTCTTGSVVSAITSTGLVTCSAIFSEQTCTPAGTFMTGISSSGTITCATP